MPEIEQIAAVAGRVFICLGVGQEDLPGKKDGENLGIPVADPPDEADPGTVLDDEPF